MNPGTEFKKSALVVSALLVCCTLIALAGTDLVLPAIPELPGKIGGNIAQAQLVLATFAAGTGLGLMLFGELSARYQQRWLLFISLCAYAVMSELAAQSETIEQLIFLRFFQGLASACAAVVAPGMIKAMYGEGGAIRALGILGSIESLAPAIAPVFGVWLLALFGWQASFHVTAGLAFFLACLVLLLRDLLPRVESSDVGAYWALICNHAYRSYAGSQALALAGLLVFVFGAPSVITLTMGGTISDFIIMQICGISTYILAANLSQKLTKRWGIDRTIIGGTLLSVFGSLLILGYALAGGQNPVALWVLFVPLNMGFGLRGPTCFYQALVVSNGDDARASALMILSIMLITALGTAITAPFIIFGLVSIASASVFITLLSLYVLFAKRKKKTGLA